MSDVMSPLFSEVLIEGDFSENIESDLFSCSDWSSENIKELNRSLDMALSSDEDRLGLESPDSGIHMSNFDFDIEGCSALLSGNDPNLNTAEMPVDKSIIEDQSVIYKELILPVTPSENFDIISTMETEEENQENIAVDTNSAKAIEIHSYSVMKVKKPKTLKSRRPATASRRHLTITNQGQQYDIPLKKGKKKLYECDPLNDPIAERNRLNALNAKKNRDKKKNELLQATVEIEKLREENEELKAETDEYREKLQSANLELEKLRRLLDIEGGSRLGNKVSRKTK